MKIVTIIAIGKKCERPQPCNNQFDGYMVKPIENIPLVSLLRQLNLIG